jgi:hypothetical protein
MLSVGILMASFPTKQTYERRIILLYEVFTQPEPIADVRGHSDSGARGLSFSKLG